MIEIFEDREEAGRILGEVLAEEPFAGFVSVYGLPRGGVVVADEVAKALNCPLGIVGVAKVSSAKDPEFAIGAVAEEGVTVWSSKTTLVEKILATGQVLQAKSKVEQSVKDYRDGRHLNRLTGESAVLIDDGIATGLTALAAIQLLMRKNPIEVIVASPIADERVVAWLSDYAKVIALNPLRDGFVANGYRNFGQVDKLEVLQLLNNNY
jgi:putative phosphoribosyl transferase